LHLERRKYRMPNITERELQALRQSNVDKDKRLAEMRDYIQKLEERLDQAGVNRADIRLAKPFQGLTKEQMLALFAEQDAKYQQAKKAPAPAPVEPEDEDEATDSEISRFNPDGDTEELKGPAPSSKSVISKPAGIFGRFKQAEELEDEDEDEDDIYYDEDDDEPIQAEPDENGEYKDPDDEDGLEFI
jgi:hypothetical protein